VLPGRLCSGVPHGDEAAVAVGLARVVQQVGQVARLQQQGLMGQKPSKTRPMTFSNSDLHIAGIRVQHHPKSLTQL
jgi:hypothetical protein